MDIDRILRHVRRTNKFITKEELLKELNKCRYSAKALEITVNNTAKHPT